MIYDAPELQRCAANYTALSPVSILKRVERVHPELPAQIHGAIRRNWGEVAARCKRLASALAKRGVGKGDTVALIAPNIPEALECALATPMLGAVLNANNVRLDAGAVAYILEHGEAKVLLVDTEFSDMAAKAVVEAGRDLLVIDIEDSQGPGGDRIGALTYEELLAEGDPDFAYVLPDDEWDALALNYTSGTTGRPKGVVYSHRGAWANAVNNVVTWEMPHHPIYLWTLPLFHCNGWCFPWTITMLAGTHVFLRAPRADAIYDAFADHGVNPSLRRADHHVADRQRVAGGSARLFARDQDDDRRGSAAGLGDRRDGGDGDIHHPCLRVDGSLRPRRRVR